MNVESCDLIKMHCQEPWFSKIKYGQKRVEGRKFSEKYANLKPGDKVHFCCEDDRFIIEVLKVINYKSLEAYLLAEGFENALPGIASFDEAVNVYLQYNNREELDKAGGFLAIHLEVINGTVANEQE